MIDIIVNDHGGLTLVYDDDSLDECTGVLINTITGNIKAEFLTDKTIDLTTVAISIRQMLKDDMKSTLIKMNGWSLAKTSSINMKLIH